MSYTPEEQEAYDKEMQRLEAEAPGKGTETPSKVEEPAKAEPKTDDGKTEVSELRAKVESLEKSNSDTKRWAQQNAAEVKRLKLEADERKRQENEPPILAANPGLADAIKHVAGAPKAPEENWLQAVGKAIPDVEALLSNPEFHEKAQERRRNLGAEWDDPLNAIRELTDLKASHIRDQAVRGAVETAKKDFEAKAQKRSAMNVPGGSGGKDSQKQVDEAERYRTMSNAEFAKERSRVMGY